MGIIKDLLVCVLVDVLLKSMAINVLEKEIKSA
jgi:hypothetical protein